MNYTIEPHPEERLIICSVEPEFDVSREIDDYMAGLQAALDQMPAPAVNVADARNLTVNFGSMTGALSMLTHGTLSVMRHPMLCAAIVITTNPMITLGVRALGQAQYGSLRAMTATTLEEGITLAKNELAARV